MERPRGFYTKRSEHFNNIQKEENKKKAIQQSLSVKDTGKVTQEQTPSPKVENLDPNKSQPLQKTPTKERPLKCLETLAQKAGITFDEKYENSLTMEKSQSPAQQQVQQTQQLPLQFTPDQFQQIVNAYAAQGQTIQVKQEYANQQQSQGTFQDQQNQLQQMQIVQSEAPQSPHQNQAQNALQQAVQAGQVPAEYLQAAQRVQVLPQTLQNAQYLTQQMYSPQLVMSGNLLTHSGLGQQPQIQLIAAGKQFQNQLTPQMLATTGGKPVLTTNTQGFSSYAIPSSQPQTLLFSPVTVNGVLNSQNQQQQNNQQQILSSMQTQNTPTKQEGQKQMGQKVVQKVGTQGQTTNQQQQQANAQQAATNQQTQQCVQVSQTMPTAQILGGQAMQFAASPWQLQGMTPFWATANGLQPQTLQLATNPIFIRGTNPDGTPVLFQQSPQPQTQQQTVQSPHNQISLVGNIQQQTPTAQKVRPATDMQQKSQVQPRTPTILPQGAPIRPASSVSTQTAMNQNANLMAKTPKVRTKQTPVRPAAPQNIKVINQQTGQPTTMMQQVVTPTGVNKMVVMSNINGQLTPVLQQNNTQQILGNDKLKAQQQVILQQAMANQQLANLQQNAAQQQAIQQQIQQIQLQQQQLQLQSQAGIQNVQLMAAQSGLPQVILQSQQMPTVSSGVSLQQTLPTQINQQGIMTKAGTHQILQMPASSQASVVSVPSSMTNTQIVTSIAGTVSSDTSNSILGPLSSPQTPLQPPQNPLIAMTTLSASPMSNVGMSTKVDAASGENKTISTSSASTATSSPLKSTQAEEKKDNKKEETKKEENAGKSQPSTPAKSQTTAPASGSPLATQNGESDGKKSTSSTPVSAPLLKNELPKAMVKPNVLTHVIEGYVIQESNEPFPVTRQRYAEKENDEPPKKKQALESDVKTVEASPKVNGESSSSVSSSTPVQSPSDMVACEHCGKQEMRSKLRRKRFCSLTCARASKSSSTDASPVVSTNNESATASPSPADKSKTEGGDAEAQSVEEHVMMKWSVTQVCDFIKNLPGCSDYADDFALQEIDGQALLLLKENHLVSAMGMKLGPALKIVNKIESMRVSQEGEGEGEGSSEGQPQQQTP